MKLVGRYQVQEQIGQGAMADVYRAYDPGIDRVLAIKVLKDEFRQSRECTARFLREAKAAGALSHPNIVTIYDVGEVDGYPYIAMELLDGEPLDEAAKRGRLSIDITIAIGLQLAEALHYAHDLGVIHRDIKPSNMMLGKNGRSIKILDFGIARVAEADQFRNELEHLKTRAGQVLGTPRYMSPEQALGRELDGRSDLFSLGVVLYELITGRNAFSGRTVATLALQITQTDPEPITSLSPDCPCGLQFIVDKLLAKRPEKRFTDGGQLAAALKREQAALALLADDEAGRKRRIPMQVRLTMVMASVVATVLLLSIGAVLSRQYEAMERMALTSGSSIAAFVADNAALRAVENATLPPQERDWLPVQAFISAASEDPNVGQMTMVDADGVIRGATDPARLGHLYNAPADEPLVHRDGDLTIRATHSAEAGDGFRFVRTVTYAGRSFGKIDIIMSKAELQSAADLSRALLVALGLIVLLSVMATSYAVARHVAMPLRRLRKAFQDAAAGNVDFRISHLRKDEFGELFDGFNHFSAAMQERIEAVETATSPVGDVAMDATRIDASVAQFGRRTA